MYQQINLSDHSLVGAPGPLPYAVAGWPDALLLDLSQLDPSFGLAGMAFWPVVVTTPSYDATKQVPDGTFAAVADPKTKTVTATVNLRDLTPAELATVLVEGQTAKIATLTAACAAQIVGGYPSSALGPAHTYPSKPNDQINMLGSVTASLLPGIPADWTTPFWCADATGTWSFQMHTAAQIQKAGADGKTAVAVAQTKLATLSAEVGAAKTLADLDAIAW